MSNIISLREFEVTNSTNVDVRRTAKGKGYSVDAAMKSMTIEVQWMKVCCISIANCNENL